MCHVMYTIYNLSSQFAPYSFAYSSKEACGGFINLKIDDDEVTKLLFETEIYE